MPKRSQRPGGKYAPLREYLTGLSGPTVTLRFSEMETILGEPLPLSASTSKAWWSNNTSAPQYDSWHQAGWQVARVDLRAQTVTFVRQPPPPDSPI
jgi:hypothetical protein